VIGEGENCIGGCLCECYCKTVAYGKNENM